ncbi:MAG: undecaprenyldiphospho-muramoylpentapeptide beta-N-acetylglucosaminyltransferase [Bacteroidia bacterium]|nr:undecaprenyldiphospho-muramoylpentapeptide beta-N-acetylglucosaminyltransferase [Bacteroidia bacterium]
MGKRIIISGGGTGGHIFPAVSIAQEIRRREPGAEILFVGAKGGMELSVVPKYGFPIESVWISGIHRQLNVKNIGRNLLFPLKLIVSLIQSAAIVRRFRPDLVVGVGGFASGPLGRAASGKGIPLFLCEQNAYPGLVNRWLAKNATRILLGNEDAARYFPQDKTIVTGNPIRSFETMSREQGCKIMGLDPSKPVVLSLGGSLGALRLNHAWEAGYQQILDANIQLVWQSGRRYFDNLSARVGQHAGMQLLPFIDNMAAAYAAADLVVSRAGGSTISELIALSKPSILVPSPNVSEDHQTKNALSLSEKAAAVLVKDADAEASLVKETIRVLTNESELSHLITNINGMDKHQAAEEIVDELFRNTY